MRTHLKEINESYIQHMRFAQKCGWRMVFAGLACVIHSLIPSVFVSTASDALQTLNQRMMERKNKSQLSQ